VLASLVSIFHMSSSSSLYRTGTTCSIDNKSGYHEVSHGCQRQHAGGALQQPWHQVACFGTYHCLKQSGIKSHGFYYLHL
jgi:hypothetical protein